MIELTDPLFAARHATQIPNDWFRCIGTTVTQRMFFTPSTGIFKIIDWTIVASRELMC
ncbi:hypothetical protein J4464_04160 [Candidatus Woesearchaeota archaeon]|nr:hypothetical protein [Candidatus Woesearchaeota archaeon]